MTWNYRIIRHMDGHYALHEVFYNDEGEPNGMTAQPVSFSADAEEGPDGIAQALSMALNDAKRFDPLPADRFVGS